MTQSQPDTMDRALEAIAMALMPFLLLGAGDDPEKARAAVADLIRAYNPTDVQQLDLAARIVGFGLAALDNLRLSMARPELSDTKVLRFRSSAVSLNRSAEQCRTTLNTMQSEPKEAKPAPQQPAAPQLAKPQAPVPPMSNLQMEKARSDARALLSGLAKLGEACAPGQGMTAIHRAPDAQLTDAITAALSGKNIHVPAVLRR